MFLPKGEKRACCRKQKKTRLMRVRSGTKEGIGYLKFPFFNLAR